MLGNYNTRAMWKYATRDGRIQFSETKPEGDSVKIIRAPDGKHPMDKPKVEPEIKPIFGEENED